MLTLGAGSSCDVCFERFAQEGKAPCSISCGHVFCVDCISHIQSCPLCRKSFDQSSCIKLHLDVDGIPLDQTNGSSPDDIQEAQRLQRAIAGIADSGIDEQSLRQLIQETKTFLQRQPRHLFRDLRVAHRMIAYLCELKASFRAQRQLNDNLNEQMHQLASEKTELLKKVQQSEEARVYERDTALAVEKSLREHNALAVRNYHVLIQVVCGSFVHRSCDLEADSHLSQYNKLAQSTTELLKKAPRLSYPATADQGTSASDSISPMTAILPAPDMEALKGVAIRDSESSFLISPLPQFTHNLPSILDGITPLPELTEDIDGEEKEDDEDDEEISTPDSAQQSRPIEQHDFHRQPSGEVLPLQRSDDSRATDVSGSPLKVPFRRTRSRSIPSRPTSPTTPASVRSASASPPKLAIHHLTSSPSRPSLYPHHTRESYTPSVRNSNPDGDALRSRLHDLLRDSSTPSSLPNMSSLNKHDRESPAPNPPVSPFNPGLPNSNKTSFQPHNSSDNFAHLLASGPQMTNKPAPVPSPNLFVGQRYSSASSEAKKLEEERRRKYLEEKQQRHRERAERSREDRRKEERHKEGQERRKEERYATDERVLVDADPHQSKMTMPSRRDQPTPVNQSYVFATSSNGSPLKRRPSTGNAAAVPPVPIIQEHGSGHHPRHASSSNSKSRPVPIPATSAQYA